MTLSTNDLAKGTDLLNDLMEMYVQRAVEDRRGRATEHVRHAEEELFRAEANEENCRKLLRNFNEKMVGIEFEQTQIPDTLRQYTTAFNAAVLAQTTFKTQIQEYNATRLAEVKELNRKMLSELAVADPAAFDAIVEKVRPHVVVPKATKKA